MQRLEKSIRRQRDHITESLGKPLKQIAGICSEYWHDRIVMDLELKSFLETKVNHSCRLLYAIDNERRQYSSNISVVLVDDVIIGQDLSHRPYLDCIEINKGERFFLSDVYIDKQIHKPCITALHSVIIEGVLTGYVAADFDLKDLPLKNVDEVSLPEWRQIKGDPSIRGALFQQTRTDSAMDERIDEVMDVIESLITEQGIFHAKLHFSSSRATLWPYNDPYHYRLHVLEEIISPKVCLVYAKAPYPDNAVMDINQVSKVLGVFKILREADETIYLRSASLNIMNGIVGLNFSCDGSHYMTANEFLSKNLEFWFGGNDGCEC